MIINPKQHPRSIAIATAGLFCVTLIAWNHEPVYQSGDTIYYQDTVPSQRPKTSGLRDLDVELEKLDRAIERLEHLKTRDWDHISERVHEQLNKINIEEMSKQAELAMKAVDLNKINIEAQKALKTIDVELVQKQVNEAIATVKIDTDAIQKAMNEVKIDTDVIQKAMNEVKVELDRELAEIKDLNTEEINEAMDAVKVELKKAKEELKAENKDFKKELDNAKTDIQEAKKEIRGYQDMIYSMEKEGLVDTKNDYKIVYRDGSIFINDKKQTDAVTAKYRKYLKNNITIKKENGRFNIDSKQSKVD
ncbi:hypothetical protein [Flavitalea sp.]|nr:hypothetical protein [Flavitalea sp.]